MSAVDASLGAVADSDHALPDRGGSRRRFEIPSLDGIRAFAFLLVFLSHTQLNGIVPGGFGVTVFFFLSGYLIASLLRREAEDSRRISLKSFYLRRALRIFPPMYLVIAAGSLLTHVRLLRPPATATGLSAECFYFTNYYIAFRGEEGLTPGLGSLWSLAVEEHFYLLFPITYLLLRQLSPRPQRQLLALGMLWAAVSAWRCFLVLHWHVAVPRASLASDTRLDSILIGCMLAIYENPYMDRSAWSDTTWKSALGAGVGLLMISFFLPGIALRESIRYSLQNWALVPVFVCAVRFPQWILFRILNYGWVKFIGVLSYSLYLWHGPMIYACARLPTFRPVQSCCALVLSFIAALAVYLLVERPCARLRKRLR